MVTKFGQRCKGSKKKGRHGEIRTTFQYSSGGYDYYKCSICGRKHKL